MNQKTWPCKSNLRQFTALSFQTSPKPPPFNFSDLPYDALTRIAASFGSQNVRAASLVCRAWSDALRPLREAMVYLKRGKRYKHGRAGVEVDLGKALELFIEGAARGSTLAMVDAGLVCWEVGRRGEALVWYRKGAQLGDLAAMCHFALSSLLLNPLNTKEAIEWLYQASGAGHIRAQYQLALCLHQGRGVNQNLHEAARWYLRAAEGGYVRAMYNTAMCYSVGQGLVQSHRLASKWMRRAADHGHSKAQYEHGLGLFSKGDMMKAIVYLELAIRSGERGANHVKNVILQQLPVTSLDRAMLLADNWRALPSVH